VAAAALHEGALVANYPWDGYPDQSLDQRNAKHATPDDATFVHLARVYAMAHTTMAKSEVGGGSRSGSRSGTQ
jgi:carboxypeptidase D